MVIKSKNNENLDVTFLRVDTYVTEDIEESGSVARRKVLIRNSRNKKISKAARKSLAAFDGNWEKEEEESDDNSREIKGAKKVLKYAMDDTRIMMSEFRKRDDTSREKIIEEESADYEGCRENQGDADYEGKKKQDTKLLNRIVKVAVTQILLLAKAVLVAMANIAVISIAVAVVAAVITITVVQNATYNFVVDEEEHIREMMSNTAYTFSQDISEKKEEYECDIVISEGQLADWKEVIALWWTIKYNQTESAQWDSYFSGDDQESLTYIFYQFNNIEYDIVNSEDKVLKVNISNKSLEELTEHWGLDAGQQEYLNELLSDESVWYEILGTTELSQIAYAEIGNGSLKYLEWYDCEGIEKSNAFVSYCLGQLGLIEDWYIQVSIDTTEFKTQMQEKGFYKFKGIYSGKEGDIVFLNMNKTLKLGIITRIDDADNIYVTMCGYENHDIVEEIVLSNTSVIIDGYASLGSFFVTGVSGLYNGDGRENVINIALQFVGVKDDGNNKVIFNTDYYGYEASGPQYPWCVAFVWDIFRMAGCSSAFYNSGKTADCDAVLEWAERENLIVSKEMAQPGDLVLFDWVPKGDGPDHIGIVYQINGDGSLRTIEGNTGGSSDGNGGEVMIRDRSDIYIVIRPEY